MKSIRDAKCAEVGYWFVDQLFTHTSGLMSTSPRHLGAAVRGLSSVLTCSNCTFAFSNRLRGWRAVSRSLRRILWCSGRCNDCTSSESRDEAKQITLHCRGEDERVSRGGVIAGPPRD